MNTSLPRPIRTADRVESLATGRAGTVMTVRLAHKFTEPRETIALVLWDDQSIYSDAERVPVSMLRITEGI